jgi:3-oxoacyl-[acyl-carrier-protein] synthase-1
MAAQIEIDPVYAIATNIVSPLGLDTPANWSAIASGKQGVRKHEDTTFDKQPFWASKIDERFWTSIKKGTANSLSTFEQLAAYSAKQALQNIDIDLDDTVFILSSTKGNIDLLDNAEDERLCLHSSAHVIAKQLSIKAQPIVVSQACVSGVAALLYGLRMLQSGRYKYAVVTGCDLFTRFVLSGFQSFHAIANEPCRPFDAKRKGINLGEAAATIILSTEPGNKPLARLVAGATSNDANHISGPSRTGEELALAINRSLQEAKLNASQVDMVSAHGTATMYNDEMEAKAFGLAGLADTPVYSIKGYLGHTLGAAGVLESAMVIEHLQQQQLIASAGYGEHGVSEKINVTTKQQAAKIRYALKTASGFGGSNAVAIWEKM